MLAPAVAARAETWNQLGFVWQTGPILANHGKPLVNSVFESATRLAAITVWVTGEAELETVRLSDGRIVNKHYDLALRDDLALLLDELVDLITNDRVPAGCLGRQ
jgi:hypothetical protein